MDQSHGDIEGRIFPTDDGENGNKSDGENEDEEDEVNDVAYLKGLSFKSMIVASLFMIGYSFRYFPQEILSETVDAQHTLDRMKSLLSSFLLDENDEVRCQSFATYGHAVLGLLEHLNLDLQIEFLKYFNDVAISETVNVVLNRVFTTMTEWVNDLKNLLQKHMKSGI